MRTSIILDDKLIERAQKLTGIKTKREVVHEALRTLVLLHEQAEARQLRGKLAWEGDLEEMRTEKRTLPKSAFIRANPRPPKRHL